MDMNERIGRMSKAITDLCPENLELDECAKIVINAAVDAGIPLHELEEAIRNY